MQDELFVHSVYLGSFHILMYGSCVALVTNSMFYLVLKKGGELPLAD